MTIPREQVMDKVVALTKRRGFIYPTSEIYGGLSGFYDYGPYGVALKRNIRELWWRHMVELRDDVVGLESALIMNTEVWRASGHVDNFVDPLVQCLGECKRRWRADQLSGDRCPSCGGELLGITPERLRLFDHPKESLSHYSKQTTDIEYQFPFGWGELEGIADRTDFDLRVHQERSGEDLTYLDPETNERYLPWVIEPAVSVERIFITLLLDAYDEDVVNNEPRVLLRLHPNVAPVQVAVVPLSKKEEQIKVAKEVVQSLRGQLRVEYDQTGGHI